MIKVRYAEDFLKDLKKLKGTAYYQSIKAICFDQIPALDKPFDIPALKKLKGNQHYYRIRKGEFRIGVRIEGDEVVFLRCMARKDIYKYFP